jgi:hypothetical protein
VSGLDPELKLQFSIAIVLVLAAPLLAGCLERGESAAPSTLSQDDDTFCRAGGTVAPGSSQYIACRKDRDAQRATAEARADRKQRDLGEFMLNHPEHP